MASSKNSKSDKDNTKKVSSNTYKVKRSDGTEEELTNFSHIDSYERDSVELNAKQSSSSGSSSSSTSGSETGNEGTGECDDMTVVYQGPKYSLTDAEIKYLTNVAIQENGNSEVAIRCEGSIMCNLYENTTKYKSVYDYVVSGGWFAGTSIRAGENNKHNVTEQQMGYIKEVICDGQRVLPKKINEHGCFSDMMWIKTNGTKYTTQADISNPENYVKDETIIQSYYNKNGHRITGSQWKFYRFCRSQCKGDPYGYRV